MGEIMLQILLLTLRLLNQFNCVERDVKINIWFVNLVHGWWSLRLGSCGLHVFVTELGPSEKLKPCEDLPFKPQSCNQVIKISYMPFRAIGMSLLKG